MHCRKRNLTIVYRRGKREKSETRDRKTSVRGFEMVASITANAFREKGQKWMVLETWT